MKKLPSLKYWANKYSNMYWGLDIDCPISWDAKTKLYGYVRFRYTTEKNKARNFHSFRIAINPVKTLVDDQIQFHKTLKHELCHYHLLLQGIDHHEFDEVFLNELRRVGGSMPYKIDHWQFHCKFCGVFVYNAKRNSWSRFQKLKPCKCKQIGYRKYPIGGFLD